MSDTVTPPTLPTIHLNGSGRDTLRQEYTRARKALRDTFAAFGAITVHGRDYYPQGPAAHLCALAEHHRLWSHFQAIERHLTAHVNHLTPPADPS
jgi:hypothetical protein